MCKKYILPICLSVVSLTVLAKKTDLEHYQVEVVVFAQPGFQAKLDKPSLKPDLLPSADRFASASSINLGKWRGRKSGRVPNYTCLPQAFWHLKKLDQTLLKSADYIVVSHLAWRQTLNARPQTIQLREGFPNLEAKSSRIEDLSFTKKDGAGRSAYPILGQITLRKSLYVNAQIQLGVYAGRSTPPKQVALIQTQRIIKLDHLTYIDHPAYGLLINIHKVS